MAAESATGVPLELVALLTPLPADGGPVPGEILEHEAHAVGHAAVLLADRGVLLAGDMLSDVLIPLLDPRRPGQLDAYEAALDRLGEAAGTSTSSSPATARWPRAPRWRPAWPPTAPTSTRCGAARNRSTRGWTRTGSPAPTGRTRSRREPRPAERRVLTPASEPLARRSAGLACSEQEVEVIRVIEGLPDGVLGFEASGRLTAHDYADVLAPAPEAAAADGGKIRVLLDFSGEFHGMDAGAVWPDVRMGVRDWNAWERIALVTDHTLMRNGLAEP